MPVARDFRMIVADILSSVTISSLWNVCHTDVDTCEDVRGILLLETNSCSTCGVGYLNLLYTVHRYVSIILCTLSYAHISADLHWSAVLWLPTSIL